MAGPLQKLGRLKDQDSKRSDGAIEVRQIIRALNKVYEVTITTGFNVHSIFLDFGYNGVQGWIINDGSGQIKWSFSRDGLIFGEVATMLVGERTDLNGLDIHSIKIDFVTVTSSYRIWQI